MIATRVDEYRSFRIWRIGGVWTREDGAFYLRLSPSIRSGSSRLIKISNDFERMKFKMKLELDCNSDIRGGGTYFRFRIRVSIGQNVIALFFLIN